MRVDRDQALAFRIAGHHLHERTDPLTAVAACGVQEYPPGWAAVALGARAEGAPDPADVVVVNAMRGAPHVVPRADARSSATPSTRRCASACRRRCFPGVADVGATTSGPASGGRSDRSR